MVRTCNPQGDPLTEKLQEVQLEIITNSDCQAWFQEKGVKKEVKPELMCAAYWNSCEVGTRDIHLRIASLALLFHFTLILLSVIDSISLMT